MRRFAFILISLTAACVYAAQSVKTVNGLAIASVKTMSDLAIANVKNVDGLDNTSGGGVSTSYANTGGTGDRTGIITITENITYGTGDGPKLINGVISATNCYWVSVGSNSTLNLQFDFGSGKVIDEAKWYQSHAVSHGTWQWEGSNDASSWTAIGSTFDLGGSAGTETLTTLSGNTTSYRYYRLHGISGNVSSGPWLYEIEFKISS